MNKALFLDRDGVINKDEGYTYKNLILLDGIIPLCQKATELEYKIVIVTNQAGIGMGYYTQDDFWLFMDEIRQVFSVNDITIHGIYFAPYYAKSENPKYRTGEEFRKPNCGMILQAQKDLNINLGKSILVGDRITDIQAGMKAGIGRNILIMQDTSHVIL